MRNQLRCRQCVQHTSRTAASPGGARRPFAITGSLPHYAPDRPFKLEHVCLDLKIDPVGKTLEGVATQRLKTIAADQAWIDLDQIGLTIEETQVGGIKTRFEVEGERLRILLPAPKPIGEVFEVNVRYRVRDSRRGLYFTGPDADHPQKPYQVWSQGQDEDSRYWFPSFDYPNQKATSEIIALVPKGYTAVSNGALVERKEQGAQTRYHYRLGTPHVTYLITLAVAEFAFWEDKGRDGLPIQYYVAPGREADGKRSFGNTPAMIEVFERKTGMPYPYEKYSQVAVQDFIWGGMENTSATTQTDLTLHDERAHLDFSSDGLVSHELAHQWFGDLLTCRDWSHGWLNEGFATFMERVWIEGKAGPDGGWDEAKYYTSNDLRDYLDEDRGAYRRPIVCNTYVEPTDLFDAHLYQKGGLVLNLMRHVLGEDAFWRSIQAYVARHRGGSVETLDLIRAIEDTTGRNLRRFFDQWVFAAGHPDFEISYTWHEDKKWAELVIEQKQTNGLQMNWIDGFATPLFDVPAVIELTLADGQKISRRIELGQLRERVFVPAESKPVMVRFDPDSWIPKTLKFPRPKEMLLYQLKHDKDCMGRIEAALELALIADTEIIGALAETVAIDPFWGVQADAASALGSIRTDQARDALIAALGRVGGGGHPKARRAIVRAIGGYKDERAAAAILSHARKDASYTVEAEATTAWVSARLKRVPAPSARELDEVEAFLIEQLGKDSHREQIRAAALHALAELPGIGRGERPRAVVTLIDNCKRGLSSDIRTAAVVGLGAVAKVAVASERARLFEVMGQLSDESNYRLRLALVPALRAAGGPEAAFLLWKIRSQDIDGRVRRKALAAMEAVDAAGSTPEAITELRDKLGKLEEECRKLRGLVEEGRAPSSGRLA